MTGGPPVTMQILCLEAIALTLVANICSKGDFTEGLQLATNPDLRPKHVVCLLYKIGYEF